jgi:hypothetical protein
MIDCKRGDVVQIRNGEITFPGLVSDVTPCYLFVGNLCIDMSRSISNSPSDALVSGEPCIDSTGRTHSAVRDTKVRVAETGQTLKNRYSGRCCPNCIPVVKESLQQCRGWKDLQRGPEYRGEDPDGKGVLVLHPESISTNRRMSTT